MRSVLPKVKKKEEKDQVSIWEQVQSTFQLVGTPWMISVLLVVIFFTALFFVHLTVMDDAAFKYGKSSLEMKSEIPRWVEENGLTTKIRLNTKEVSKAYQGKSFFDEETLGTLHTALMGTHWIKDVSLEKSFPSKIHMSVNFRKPVVAFLYKDYWYTLDAEGYIVPIVEKKGVETLDVVRFIDVPELENRLKPGDMIEISAIKKALKLSTLITERVTSPGKLLRIIFIKDIEEKSFRYKLIFQNGLELLWGNYLSDEEVDRFPTKFLTSEEKLGALFTTLSKNPSQLHINLEFSK